MDTVNAIYVCVCVHVRARVPHIFIKIILFKSYTEMSHNPFSVILFLNEPPFIDAEPLRKNNSNLFKRWLEDVGIWLK